MARTIIVGDVGAGAHTCPSEVERLVKVAKQAFIEGIKFAKPGFRIGDISSAIGNFVEKNGFSVVKEFQGHGVRKKIT